MTWLAIRAVMGRIPAWAYTCILGVIGLISVWVWHNSQVKEAASEGIEKGAKAQRETDLVETIQRTETANETRQVIQNEVRAGNGAALYDQCLRTARTPANCKRFLPSVEAPIR